MSWQLVGNLAGRPGADGRDGADADQAVIAELRAEIVQLKSLVAAKPTFDPEQIKMLVASAVSDAVARLPVPRDGRDGQSVTLADVAPIIASEVTKAVAAIPVPKNGEPGAPGPPADPEMVESLVAKQVRLAVEALPRAKDGVGIASTLIDRHGHLICALTDGTTADVGQVIGRDADMEQIAKWVTAEVAKIPPPKDGRDGRDGVDGKGFDDLARLKWIADEQDPRRSSLVVDRDGAVQKVVDFVTPTAIWVGVWDPTKTYVRADCVSWDGAVYHAQATNTGVKPGEPDEASRVWALYQKRGDRGRTGPEGKSGPPGRDAEGYKGKWGQ